MNNFLRGKLGLLVIPVTFLLVESGCGYIALTRKTEFVPGTEGTKISISETKDGPYTEVTSKNHKIKLNHWKKQYFLKLEKPGFVSRTEELTRTSTNRLKKLDIALLIPTGIFATVFTPMHFVLAPRSNFTPSIGQSIALYSALGVGVAGWGVVIPAPGKIYPKKVDLPELIEIVTKDTNQLSLVAGEHEFELKKRKIRVRDYPGMKQYDNGYGYESRDTISEFEFMLESDRYSDVVAILEDAEYGIDSTEAELLTSLKLKSWTHSLIYICTDDQIRCEVKVGWALQTMDELQYLYDRSFSGYSEWLPYKEDMLDEDDKKSIISNSFSDAMDVSFKKFIALDTVQSILSSPVPIPLAEDTLITLFSSNHSASVGDAVQSVITVVSDEGHGSGCIVTEDGYIITNAHVVEEDTVNLKAIMSDNVEEKVPLKFIRMNEAVDLALLKLDSTGLKTLKLGTKEDIVTGSDVYAIGTPADVELGQTVTRGIISGKRKFGGHQFIQTDVAISPGNSGGGLISSDGVLLGIVTSEMRSRRIDDIGFAIPAHQIEEALKIKINQ